MSKKKKIIIGSAAAAVVVIGIVVALLMIFNKEDAYRVIKVLEIDGASVVEREDVGEIQAYAGMALQSGDKISVQSNSTIILQLDDDKYAYVEENSVLHMVAEGTSRDSKTRIQLEQGALTCHVDSKLNSNSSYEVHTQNSVMAVRGTVFRVEICSNQWILSEMNDDTQAAVQISVYDGEVSVTLKHPDGTLGESHSVLAGEKAGVGNNTTDSFFLTEEELNKLPVPEESRQVLLSLQSILQKGEKLSVTQEDLDALLEELNNRAVYEVYFYANGELFGIQEVANGQTPVQPGLSPSPNGRWDVDFSKPITGNTEIYWVE